MSMAAQEMRPKEKAAPDRTARNDNVYTGDFNPNLGAYQRLSVSYFDALPRLEPVSDRLPDGGCQLLNTASDTLYCFSGYQALDIYRKQRKQMDCFAIADYRAIDTLNFCFVRGKKIILVDTHIQEDMPNIDCSFRLRECLQVIADRFYAYGAEEVHANSFAFAFVSDMTSRYEVTA